MGKWTAMLAEHAAARSPAPSSGSTDKTDKRGLLSVLAVGLEGGAAEVRIADDDRTAARLVRLLRWGWPAPEAEAMAERLARRDRESDERVACVDCSHYQPGRCNNHRRADLSTREIGRDFASLLQRCPAATSPTAGSERAQ